MNKALNVSQATSSCHISLVGAEVTSSLPAALTPGKMHSAKTALAYQPASTTQRMAEVSELGRDELRMDASAVRTVTRLLVIGTGYVYALLC